MTVLEHHFLGADGIPAKHETSQVIRSMTDGLESYLYRFDTNALTVEVERGGRAGQVRRVGDGIWAVDIVLTKPLRLHETASLSYRTTFRYQEPPDPVMRRAVPEKANSVEIYVRFHPDKLPGAVWWCTWDGLDGGVLHEAVAELDDEHSVHKFLEGAEKALVGFRWEW
ncbi:hypothetical protein [Motilibacter aurantiacus]|uniref:hypothetical protein n=1 Tax=Motilibacter aurantiacus TaxID=2714955 RepID=UPI0014087DAA|nr:hypothetical protein [Motilibacter aurantiacus]NHC46881.1 hypothetical protein [Motilibacter aurantiacus]